MVKKVHVNIDGQELTGHLGQTILEIARENGIDIPTLCHDPRLAPYAACGLCVVEIEGSPRLVRSCATEAQDGQVIFTDSEKVRSSRRMTLELLLSDHQGDCRPPCMLACPAHTDCQGYVGLIANGNYREAVALIKDKLPMPASIGLICPHPCEDACRRQLVEAPVAIAALKSFAGEMDLKSANPFRPAVKEATGKKVAVVGAGPAGLTAAYFLARDGHEVNVYDAMPEPGGMLRYGIPEYRLPKSILDQEIDLIRDLGVSFYGNTRLGDDLSLEYLRKHFDAVFLAIGAWRSSKLRCPGEELPGVVGGIDFLRQVALGRDIQIGDRVAVVGGGNTAMDAARTAVRLGASQVMVLYRRTRQEMPAQDIEVEEAMEEGVEFRYLVAPVSIEGEGRANAIRVQRMELGEPDASGRRRPVPVPGSEEDIPVDMVIAAIGQEVSCPEMKGLNLDKWGQIIADPDTLTTSLPGVFAGGDAVTGPGIAIEAIAQGQKAAAAISRWLAGLEPTVAEPWLVRKRDVSASDYEKVPRVNRASIPTREPGERKDLFIRVTGVMTEDVARAEASRCLECGCRDYFECRLIAYANQYGVNPERLQGERRKGQADQEHPFIERTSEKCILCGLCVRICDEVMGVGALGLVHRGFDTLIKPQFGIPLSESDCISCGQCVSVCPTGALLERQSLVKQVPLKPTGQIASTCSFCSVGCQETFEVCGDMTVRALPQDSGLLCSRGRFAWNGYMADRITEPLVRVNGELVKTTWEEALVVASRSLAAVRASSGGDAVLLSVSPDLTNETARLLVTLAREGLGTDRIVSLSDNPELAVAGILGDDCRRPSLEELSGTEVILQVGTLENSPIAAVRASQAARKGAKLVIMAPGPALADDAAHMVVRPDNRIEFLYEVMAAMSALGLVKDRARKLPGYHELESRIAGIKPGEEAAALAAVYGQARTAIILIDGHTVSSEAASLLATLAVLAGQEQGPRRGVITLAPGANSHGLAALGAVREGNTVRSDLAQGKIKGWLIVGEDPVGAGWVTEEDLRSISALVVASSAFTPTTSCAQVVLPLATPLESTGSFINYCGRSGQVRPVKGPESGMDNTEMVKRLAALLQVKGSGRQEELPGKRDGQLWDQSVSGEQQIFHAPVTMSMVLRGF